MKRVTWLYIAAGLFIYWVVSPMLSGYVMVGAGSVARFVPPGLAPANWVVVLLLIAICEGPVLKPKSLSIALDVSFWLSFLYFLGSWNLHPRVSPVVGVLGFI